MLRALLGLLRGLMLRVPLRSLQRSLLRPGCGPDLPPEVLQAPVGVEGGPWGESLTRVGCAAVAAVAFRASVATDVLSNVGGTRFRVDAS